MTLPLQMVFRNMERSEWIAECVRDKASALDKFCDCITSCRVTIEVPHRHHQNGNAYHVRVDLRVKDDEFVFNREFNDYDPRANVHAGLKETFELAERQLVDYQQRRHHQVKMHVQKPTGRISRLWKEHSYGFITTPDGREVYFHANCITNSNFADLSLGTEVSFAEESGDNGPQASNLKVLKKANHKKSLADR